MFQEGLGTLRGYSAKIHVDPSARPKFCKHRGIPYAYKLKVEEELNRLVKQPSKNRLARNMQILQDLQDLALNLAHFLQDLH